MWTFLGLLLGVVGSVLLAWNALSANSRQILEAGKGGRLGGNLVELNSRLDSRADGTIGAALLVASFVFQAVALLAGQQAPSVASLGWAVAMCVSVILVRAFIFRYLVAKQFAAVARKLGFEVDSDAEYDDALLGEFGHGLRMRRRSGEVNAAFQQRIAQRLRQLT